MKLAYSTLTNEEETELLFSSFTAVGYQGLQLKGNQYWKYLDTPEAFVDAYGQYPGAANGLICGFNPLDGDDCEKIRRMIRFGSGAGTDLIIVCLSNDRTTIDHKDIADIARAAAVVGQEALDQGVKITVHNHHNSPLMHRDDYDAFYGSIPAGTVGLTLDTAHVVKSGIADMAELIRSFAGVIDNYHLKDFGDNTWQVLGHGGIDFAPVFDAIRSTGYDGWISADEESGAEFIKAMEECLVYIKKGLAV